MCLIGKSRSYEQADEELADVKRADFIRGRQALITISPAVSQKERSGPQQQEYGQDAQCDWGSGFQPREKIETVRNCAALPRDFVDGVVLKVAMTLLGLAGHETEKEEEEDKIGKERIRWNPGGKKSIGESFTVRCESWVVH